MVDNQDHATRQLQRIVETAAVDRVKWGERVRRGAELMQKHRIIARRQKCLRRKNPDEAMQTTYAGATCGSPCKGRAGLMPHVRLKHLAAALRN